MLKSIKAIELIYKSSIVISFGMQPQTSAMQNNKNLQHQLCAKATTATASHENAKQQISQTTAANGLGLTKLPPADSQANNQLISLLLPPSMLTAAGTATAATAINFILINVGQLMSQTICIYEALQYQASDGLSAQNLGLRNIDSCARQYSSATATATTDALLITNVTMYVCRHMCVSVAILCAYVAMC